MTSAASSGGAAGASGVRFQDRVFGWAAAAMVAEEPTLIPLVAGTVVRVGAQTGFAIDDVAVLTDAENYALFQAKVGLNLGTTHNGALALALGQAVKQYLNGRVPRSTGTERPIDPTRDTLVLCSDMSAPATVRVDLAAAVSRTCTQPVGTPLGQGLNAKQKRALDVAVAHARRLWVADGRAAPKDEELRQFFRALQVIAIDLDPGRSDHQAAVSALARALPDADDAASASAVLVAEGLAASIAQEWRDRPAVGLALSRAGVRLSPPARFAGDIDKLRELSGTNLLALQSDAALPVSGGLYIARAVGAELTAEAGRDHVLIVGDAGAGKSAVAQELATDRQSSEELVVLRASDIAGTNRLVLSGPLDAILRAWIGPPGVILVDGVDALRGSADRGYLSTTVDNLKGSRWQVVATARTFDARNSQPLRRAFAGTPISSHGDMHDDRLEDVRHLLVGDLSDEELDGAVRPPMALATLLAEAPPELRALLRNPFNLRLAAELADGLSVGQHAQLLAVRSRVALLAEYWSWRVRNEDGTAREAVLTRLCCAMVTQRSLQIAEAEPIVLGTDSTALEALLSGGVLNSQGGFVPGARRVLSFSHNILFDYATALYVLYDPVDPSGLVRALDADPTLPLVARPSFEIFVDLLWGQRAAGAFWPVCMNVAASPHVLASLAFASRILNLVRTPDDLAPLAPNPGDTDDPNGMKPSQHLVSQLVGALRTPAVLPDASSATVPLAALASRLAENSSLSYADGALAVDLIIALQLRAPVGRADPGDEARSRAVAALLDGCRTNPQRMENLAGATARQLQHVIGTSSEVRDAVGRLLDDDAALAQWGGTVLSWIAESVAPTVPHDPALARRMATAVLTFDETRDEQVALGGGSILRLNESRRQQAEFGTYLLGKAFSEISAADVTVAAEIFCDFANDGIDAANPEKWPLSVADASGYLAYGRDLSLTRHGCGETAATALAATLAEADPAQTVAAVKVLIARLHNAAAWAAVLTPRGDPVALGRAILPALESGSLLAHPETHPSAARLLAALAEDETVPADRLEATVVRAVALADQNDVGDVVTDVLIGCLRPDGITDPELAARRSALGERPPDIPERMRVTAWSEPWSIVDSLLESGVSLEATVETAARTLREELDHARDGVDAKPESEPKLADAFLEADVALADAEAVPEALQLLLVDAAAALARDGRVVPGTAVGDRMLAVLIAAADSPDAGSLLS